MRKADIPVFETKSREEEFEGPAIVVRKGQRSVSDDETSFGAPKATYIEGIDADGEVITTRGLYERTSKPGKLWQKAIERWKTERVRFTLGSSAVELSHSELRENGL